ncbi:hypothetical protein lmo4a_0749 [Listeria monocytogenes L99]|nr:hypothetical protein lmo4a_0749 [Listeria monocytogenes L99]
MILLVLQQNKNQNKHPKNPQHLFQTHPKTLKIT